MAKQKVGQPKQSNNNMGAQSGVNLTGATVSSQSHELKTSSVADCNATITPPPAEVDHKLGHKSPPVRAMSNLSMTSYRLIKARVKQCPITLRKEDQGMTLLENGKECLISQDETKVMITRDHTQHVAVRQEDRTTKTPGMV